MINWILIPLSQTQFQHFSSNTYPWFIRHEQLYHLRNEFPSFQIFGTRRCQPVDCSLRHDMANMFFLHQCKCRSRMLCLVVPMLMLSWISTSVAQNGKSIGKFEAIINSFFYFRWRFRKWRLHRQHGRSKHGHAGRTIFLPSNDDHSSNRCDCSNDTYDNIQEFSNNDNTQKLWNFPNVDNPERVSSSNTEHTQDSWNSDVDNAQSISSSNHSSSSTHACVHYNFPIHQSSKPTNFQPFHHTKHDHGNDQFFWRLWRRVWRVRNGWT